MLLHFTTSSHQQPNDVEIATWDALRAIGTLTTAANDATSNPQALTVLQHLQEVQAALFGAIGVAKDKADSF